ncbi:uncharacterized protein LOC128126031 [Lactuca sativa]|uniref:uncharacterized protein LOC128126031 n=1 Tax=Lactuca sativa TaxID=4236 RepID=UPI0022AFBF95|nr:uncharacterized protein LOC128126031 [Lactuca sativa]
MAEEHDQLRNVEVQSNFDVEGDHEENDGDDDFLRDMDFSSFDNEEFPLNLNLDHDDLVVQTTTESRVANDVLNTMPPTSRLMVESSSHKDAVSGIPPSDTTILTSTPSSNDPTQTQTSLPPVKRRRLDPRHGFLVQDQAPQAPSTVVTTTITVPPVLTEEGPSITFETGGSSVVLEYSPTRHSLDEASISLKNKLFEALEINSSLCFNNRMVLMWFDKWLLKEHISSEPHNLNLAGFFQLAVPFHIDDQALLYMGTRKIFLQEAGGLSYQHEKYHVPIIHTDIRTSNILLDRELQQKIANFGLIRLLPEDTTHLSTKFSGTLTIAVHFTNPFHVSTRVADKCSDGTLLLQVILHSQVKANLTIHDSWLDLKDGFTLAGESQSNGRPTSAFFPLVVPSTSRAGIL